MPQFRTPDKPAGRLDSDREVLTFPEGGVFGRQDERAGDLSGDSLQLARHLEATLDEMQDRLDQLEQDVDTALSFPPDATESGDWPSPAA